MLGYDRKLGSDWRLKSEVYYQYLYHVPVEKTPSSYSVLNQGTGFVPDLKGSMVNKGTGRNYGVELTLEKFFSKGYYMLMTTSLFDSRYKGSDGVQRNTEFNNKIVSNLLFGKEWKFGKGKRNAWTFDTKFTTSKGKPYTPIDLPGTRRNGGNKVLLENQAYSLRYGDYFRWDVKLGYRLNSRKKNISYQFFIDFQNVTNRKNDLEQRYNNGKDKIYLVNQIGFFPDIMCRLQF